MSRVQPTPGPHWVEGSIYDGYAACVVGRETVEGHADRETRTLAQVRHLPDAILFAAAADMLRTLKLCIPANVCLTNPNIRDDMNVPLDVPMGDLRKIAAAIAKAEGRS